MATEDLVEAAPSGGISEAERVVRAFLAALERRDLATATTYVAPETDFTFPGGARRSSIAEVVAGSAKRYRHVGKTFERFDVLPGPDGAVVVYCFGTLHGTFLDATPFSGIRFIDRFVVEGGLIVRQDVWNDVAHLLIARADGGGDAAFAGTGSTTPGA